MSNRNRDIIRLKKSEHKSDYKYITVVLKKSKVIKYCASVLNKNKTFPTERQAAIFVDTVLILAGKQPVNILKPIQK